MDAIEDLESALQDFRDSAAADHSSQRAEPDPSTAEPAAVFTDLQHEEPAVEAPEEAEAVVDLQAALEDFVASAGGDEGATAAEAAPSEHATPVPQEPEPSSVEDPNEPSNADLQALQEFIVSASGQAGPAGAETPATPPADGPAQPQEPELPVAPSAVDLQSALDQFLEAGHWNEGEDEQPAVDTPAGEGSGAASGGDGGGTDQLQSALDSFLETVGDVGEEPRQGDTGGPGSEQQGDGEAAGLEASLEEFLGSFGTSEEPSKADEGSEGTTGDDLQSALNDFLGSMGDDEPEGDHESDAPRNLRDFGLGGFASMELSGAPVTMEGPEATGSLPDGELSGAGLLLGNMDSAVEQSAGAVYESEESQEYEEEPPELAENGIVVGVDEGSGEMVAPYLESVEESASPARVAGAGASTTVGVVEPEEVDAEALQSYSGIVHVLFSPAAADLEMLCAFWDVLETAVGVGKVTAENALADGSGHQFTMDLGEDVLKLDELRNQDSSLEVSVLGGDRLMIRMQSMAL